MWILYTDDTNQGPSKEARFFIYGGLMVPPDQLPVLDLEITKIRAVAGYRPTDRFKFETHSKPDHVSQEAFRAAKRETIDVCLGLGCKFIAYAIHHGIVRHENPDKAGKRKESEPFAVNTVIGRFNLFLHEESTRQQGPVHGMCIVDHFDGCIKHLREKFSVGLPLPNGKAVRVDRIKMFAASTDNASHLASAVDIVLGAFRYCANKPPNDRSRDMLPQVVRLMWHTRDGDRFNVLEKGLVLRPKEIRIDAYKAEYQALLDHLNNILRDVEM